MSATTATLSPDNRRFIWAIVIAQVLVQIGAFSLPALLPTYIADWNLSKTEGGWLIGIFFAAYVVAVPVLVSLTDRVPTRRVYAVGAALTAISHLGFAFVADGFWSGLILRALAGIGWAGAYMPGLKAIADTLEGNAQSRAVSMHAAGVGVAGASSFGIAGLIAAWFGPNAAFLFGGIAALVALADRLGHHAEGPAACMRRAAIRASCSIFARCFATGRRWHGSRATRFTHGRWPHCAPGASPS